MKTRRKGDAREYLTPESQKALADRLARAEGHLRSVRQMVIDHRCADEILVQLAAHAPRKLYGLYLGNDGWTG